MKNSLIILITYTVFTVSFNLWATSDSYTCRDIWRGNWSPSYFISTPISLKEEAKLLDPSLHEGDGYTEFIHRHKNFKLPDGTNKKYISISNDQNEHSPYVFLVSGFVYTRELNNLKRKDLATSLINLHKKIFFSFLFSWFHVNEKGEVRFVVNERFPLIAKYLLAPYSDFKSGNLAFAEPHPIDRKAFEEEVVYLLMHANLRFGNIVSSSGFFTNNSMKHSLENPFLWIKAGMGDSSGQAGLASLQARKVGFPLKNKVMARFSEVKSYLDSQLAKAYELLNSPEVMKLRSQKELFVEETAFGMHKGWFLSRPLMEILVKTSPRRSEFSLQEYIHEVIARVYLRFGIRLTEEQVLKLKLYKDIVNEFIPQLELLERVHLSYDSTEGLTILDFTGQNVVNHHFTEWGLFMASRLKGNSKQAIYWAKKGELLATKELDELKETIRALSEELFELRASFTGDDGMIPSAKNKVSMFQALLKHPLMERFRMTWVDPQIPLSVRDTWGTQGEEFQKAIMNNLKDELGEKNARDYLISVSVLPHQKIEVYIGARDQQFVDVNIHQIVRKTVAEEKEWELIGIKVFHSEENDFNH
ncbi:MAG: hypothetical protein KDD50_03180 [Bdellovibrionales bacterium]|nr:hypothetical protein [Bdellovibrionales bacterium]